MINKSVFEVIPFRVSCLHVCINFLCMKAAIYELNKEKVLSNADADQLDFYLSTWQDLCTEILGCSDVKVKSQVKKLARCLLKCRKEHDENYWGIVKGYKLLKAHDRPIRRFFEGLEEDLKTLSLFKPKK